MTDSIKLKHYDESINVFKNECGEFMLHLKKFKKQIKMIVPIKE